MRKLHSYEKYKNSGIPWLGDVPEHWKAIKTKHLFSERVQKGYPNEPLLAATQTKGVVPKSMYENRTVEAQKDLHLLKLVNSGDFVISLRSFQGGIEYAYYRGIISPAYTVIVPNKRILPEYYRYLAKSKNFISLLKTCVTGIREGQNINYEILRKTPMPVPPQKEQQQIARYLDWQTSKINKFIKAKKKFISLLNEQKQNIINEAVTKGINPDVEMKDSGVEWLGEIPAHWDVRKFKHISKFYSGGTPSKAIDSFWKGNIPWVSPKDMKSKYILDASDHISAEAVESSATSYVDEGQMLMVVRSGILRRTIPVCITKRMVTFNQDIRAIILNRKTIYTEYLYALINGCEKTLLDEWLKVGATVESIEYKYMANCYLPIPPIDEQQLIVSFLEKETILIDKTVTRTEQEIELIQEYRTRLVSDVVTGKVDVRSVKIPDFEPAETELEVKDDEEFEELIAEGIEE
ncbi:restriction endonuclease subunit S [Maridesulfovibrio hydrothermalis]|uniref:Type I restriction modification DNA specificity domain-containing protein n=1 Tax=Maridesulfovibrio hydrothermalis AM13 = DSM 14728 TaxID=1121451 RepID=L0R7Z1_9BACT|nr:restriction endonuclease subunit S [Maridesulfovibrio hydrothermalis]CCO22315.1 conserved protein of unknown function [Maridesulfovibrio hydrothermalis AM13 = DSM 14728]